MSIAAYSSGGSLSTTNEPTLWKNQLKIYQTVHGYVYSMHTCMKQAVIQNVCCETPLITCCMTIPSVLASMHGTVGLP